MAGPDGRGRLTHPRYYSANVRKNRVLSLEDASTPVVGRAEVYLAMPQSIRYLAPARGSGIFALPNLNRERSAYGRRYGIFERIVKGSSSLRG